MNNKATSKKSIRKTPGLIIEGVLELETRSTLPGDVSLSAYAVNKSGEVLASSKLETSGKYALSLGKIGGEDIELLVARTDDTDNLKANALQTMTIKLAEIKEQSVLNKNFYAPAELWRPWWPKRICVSGHVRNKQGCPIPFVKVEVFDVDRGPCLWPWYNKFKALIRSQKVVRIEDIQRQIPELEQRLLDDAFVGLSATADDEPMVEGLATKPTLLKSIERPQPDLSQADFRLKPVTMTSRLAPWILYPRCFYHRHLLCTDTTNQYGYFKCCFKWYPFQFRHGQFKFDLRPDIIVKVSQTLNGVTRVLYMDAHANTRWNSSGAHIDLFLDEPDFECGSDDSQQRPVGSVAFFTRIGNHEVFKINQANGTYNALSATTNNMAYGHAMRIFAQFGDTLSRLQNIPGASKPYFYKLTVNGEPISTSLKDTRVDKLSLDSESHTLGPVTRGTETALYEIRNFKDYYWYNPDWIAKWVTATTSGLNVTKLISDGLKTLKLEVFDNTGILLDNSKVNYLNGAAVTASSPPVPTSPLPSIYPCVLNVAVDNNPPVVSMQVNPAPSGCGVIKATAVPPLGVIIDVNQANNRINNWSLSYIKGTNPAGNSLDSLSSSSGSASVSGLLVDAAAMLTGLNGTCAFALTLRAEAHITNGYSQIYDRQTKQAIAIEDCST